MRTVLPSLGGERSLSRKPDGPDTLGAVRTKKTLRSPNNCRENMESVQIRHSRAVSTPPVRSVHPMDPIGSVGRGWLMGPLSSVVSRSGGGGRHADEPPPRRRGRSALASLSASLIGATAHNKPLRKVKRDRPRFALSPGQSAVLA